MLLLAIASAAVFVAAVYFLIPAAKAPNCDACGLPITSGRCTYPDCDYYEEGHP